VSARRVLPFLIAAAVACGATDRERRGDEAYARGQFAEALEIYQGLPDGEAEPRILAKTGAAALRAGRLAEATDAYLHLAGEDPTRGAEAAAGLESVAQAAERSGDGAALQQAAVGLQTIAPDAAARYALVLAQQPDAPAAELVSLLPAAIAAAGDQALVDSLLLRYGNALEATTGCGQALLQYRAVVRRAQDTGLRSAARTKTGQCALTQGHRAQAAGRTGDAALWFTEASRVDSASVTGRRALLSLGDLHLRQGDTLAAAIAFQTAATAAGEQRDSVARVARFRLARLGLTPGADDGADPDIP
jgi:tetratricopeptide (TPR) repeat protein